MPARHPRPAELRRHGRGHIDLRRVRVIGRVAESGKSVTGVAATDLFTSAGHGFTVGQEVRFSGLTGGAGITAGQAYFVIAANLTANTFQVSATPGGAALNFTTDLTAGTVARHHLNHLDT